MKESFYFFTILLAWVSAWVQFAYAARRSQTVTKLKMNRSPILVILSTGVSLVGIIAAFILVS